MTEAAAILIPQGYIIHTHVRITQICEGGALNNHQKRALVAKIKRDVCTTHGFSEAREAKYFMRNDQSLEYACY